MQRAAERGIIALVNPERLRRILMKMLDENEFLGPHGIRSLSKFHEQNPSLPYRQQLLCLAPYTQDRR